MIKPTPENLRMDMGGLKTAHAGHRVMIDKHVGWEASGLVGTTEFNFDEVFRNCDGDPPLSDVVAATRRAKCELMFLRYLLASNSRSPLTIAVRCVAAGAVLLPETLPSKTMIGVADSLGVSKQLLAAHLKTFRQKFNLK